MQEAPERRQAAVPRVRASTAGGVSGCLGRGSGQVCEQVSARQVEPLGARRPRVHGQAGLAGRLVRALIFSGTVRAARVGQ